MNAIVNAVKIVKSAISKAMIGKAIILSLLLQSYEIAAIPTSPVKIETARKRGKKSKGRRRGGNGLR